MKKEIKRGTCHGVFVQDGKVQDLSALGAYLNEYIHPKELAEVLECMLWNYVNYCLGDRSFCGNEDLARDVWTLKELIEALKQCK